MMIYVLFFSWGLEIIHQELKGGCIPDGITFSKFKICYFKSIITQTEVTNQRCRWILYALTFILSDIKHLHLKYVVLENKAVI